MTFNDLLRVFWRRKLLIILVTAAVVIPSYIGTQLVSPQYESTATLALTPHGTGANSVLYLSARSGCPPYYYEHQSGYFPPGVSMTGNGLISGTPQIGGTFQSWLAVKNQCPGDSSERLFTFYVVDPAPFVINTPELPTVQVFPRTKLTILAALLLGLALGCAAAVLRESLTTKIESAEDLARVAGVPVFAELPSETAVLGMHSAEDLAEHPRLRIVAEAMRDLRTNLLFTDDSIRSVVITSDRSRRTSTWRTVRRGLADREAARCRNVSIHRQGYGRAEPLVYADVRPDRAPLELVRHQDGVDVLVAPLVVLAAVALLHEAEPLVEPDRCVVPGEDVQLELAHTRVARPGHRRFEQCGADAAAAM